jgi:intracellular sulfur oxidation DsrE/DsrF family protein
MANLIPGAVVIPAAVLQLVLLQERGYKLVVNS